MEQVPFSRDGDQAQHLRPRYEGQAPFVDVIDNSATQCMDAPTSTTALTPPPGMTATTGANGESAEVEGQPQQPVPQQLGPIPDLEMDDFEVHTLPGLDIVPMPSIISALSGQPESEAMPSCFTTSTSSCTTLFPLATVESTCDSST